MKSLIIIVSLLISAEIQFSIGAKTKNKSVAIDVDESNPHLDVDESEIFHQIEGEDSEYEENESVRDDESQISPNILASGNQENGSRKLLTIPDVAKRNQGETPTDVDEMRKKAIANRDNSIKNAKISLERAKTNFDTLIENADMEREAALRKINEHYKKRQMIAVAIEKRASKKFGEIKQRVQNEYEQAKSAVKESYNKAAEESNVELEAAETEFEQARAQILENKRKLEDEHQPELENAGKDKEIAMAVAKDRLNNAEEKYRAAMRDKRRLSAAARKKIEKEYQEEKDKYEEAVKLADDKWQAALDNIGIGKCTEDEEQALQRLQQAQEKAESILEPLSEELEKALDEARMKRDQKMKQAKVDRLKVEKESDQMFDEAAEQQQIASHRIWAKWRKIQAQANEDLNKANSEFVKAKNEAIREYKKALKTIEEVEEKLKTMAMAPEKIVNQQFSMPKRSSNSRKLEDVPSSKRRGKGGSLGGSM